MMGCKNGISNLNLTNLKPKPDKTVGFCPNPDNAWGVYKSPSFTITTCLICTSLDGMKQD